VLASPGAALVRSQSLQRVAHLKPDQLGSRVSTVVGVDGCRLGWVAATHDLETGVCSIAVHRSFQELLTTSRLASVIAVDIPIGLGDAKPRTADLSARQFLGARASSVFPAPCRAALDGSTYESSSALSYAASGKKLTKQTYATLAKIREVDAALRTDRTLWDRVVEVHPEVSFAAMNGNQPMVHSKKRSAGKQERLSLLSPLYQAAFSHFRPQWLHKEVATDDMLDALAALWSAMRISAKAARAFPEQPLVRDSVGLPMRILA